MLAPWRHHNSERGNTYVNVRFCEDCGAVIDGDPDSTLDRKLPSRGRKTRCADDLIKSAAEELENG